MHDHRIRFNLDAVGNAFQPKVGLAVVGIAKCRRSQFALARNSRLPEIYGMLDVVKKGSQRFARRLAIQAMTLAMGLPYPPSGLHQGLQIANPSVTIGKAMSRDRR